MKAKIILSIVILTIFSNCRSKKIVVKTEKVVEVDSVYIFKEKKVIERFTDTLRIEKACDSLGNLKAFKRSFVTPQGKISIQGQNNQIQAKIDLKGYENIIEQKYKTIYEEKISELSSKEVKYRTPFYHWIIHILCALVIFFLLRVVR